MANLKLSIVVPSFNQGEFLGTTLESLVRQSGLTPGELEIIVVDGGSQDNSLAIIREFEPHLAWWVSEPDEGQSGALRKGFARSTGNILGWLCSDDILEPWAARQVLDCFGKRPQTGFLYGDACWIDRAGQIMRPKKEIPFNWFIWKYDHNYIPQPSAFWRRDLYDQAGGLDERLDLAMDSDLWARFARLTEPYHLRRPLSRMRAYPEQKTQRLALASLCEHREISSRYGATFDNPLSAAASRLVARCWRVTWKLTTGCYW